MKTCKSAGGDSVSAGRVTAAAEAPQGHAPAEPRSGLARTNDFSKESTRGEGTPNEMDQTRTKAEAGCRERTELGYQGQKASSQ